MFLDVLTHSDFYYSLLALFVVLVMLLKMSKVGSMMNPAILVQKT